MTSGSISFRHTVRPAPPSPSVGPAQQSDHEGMDPAPTGTAGRRRPSLDYPSGVCLGPGGRDPAKRGFVDHGLSRRAPLDEADHGELDHARTPYSSSASSVTGFIQWRRLPRSVAVVFGGLADRREEELGTTPWWT
ncbi:unnamed protein product [Musa banksii]